MRARIEAKVYSAHGKRPAYFRKIHKRRPPSGLHHPNKKIGPGNAGLIVAAGLKRENGQRFWTKEKPKAQIAELLETPRELASPIETSAPKSRRGVDAEFTAFARRVLCVSLVSERSLPIVTGKKFSHPMVKGKQRRNPLKKAV